MEGSMIFPVFSLSFILLFFLLKSSRKRTSNLPPSPPSLPVLGHLHLIREPVHRTLESISHRYGPVFSLSLGSILAVVVSSPSAVKECFGKNDIVFANRPNFDEDFREISYNFTSMASAPYSPLWRELRRISALEIFSSNRLNSFLEIRQEEVMSLVKNLYRTVTERGGVSRVDIRPRLQELTFNVIMRMVSGKRHFGAVDLDDFDEAKKFREIMTNVFELSGAFDPSVFLPVLRWVGFGRRRRMMEIKSRVDAMLQRLIDEHRNKTEVKANPTKTIIDLMLGLGSSKTESYSDDIIMGMILPLLAGGTDTSSVTIEWAMSLLLNHPAAMAKVRAELDNHVGQDRLIDEHDIHCLPYLGNVINETFRLCPAGPLLVPHSSSDDTTIQGFSVPRGTMLLVNAWALHRDPKLWDNATSFRLERFEGLDQASYAHKLIPFGVGRRACPGSGLARRVVALVLGALIQCFEWQRVGDELVDLSEGTGLTMPKAQPLEALCKSRNSNIANILSQL